MKAIYYVEGSEQQPTVPVQVKVAPSQSGAGVDIMVGDWFLGCISSVTGKLHLYNHIPEENDGGLAVDSDGHVITTVSPPPGE